MKDGVPMEGAQYSDMSFNDDWTFQRLVHADFTPSSGSTYACKVEHETLKEPQVYKWGTAAPSSPRRCPSCAAERPRP